MSCTALASATIPVSVTSIGSGAFAYCESLTNVTIPDPGSASYDFSDVFGNAESITSITLSNGVTGISDNAFSGCYFADNATVTIPNSVTSIGDGAFQECYGLTGVTIGSGVTSIGENAFSYCEGLTSITIPNSVTSIGDGAFWGCVTLASATIGSGVTSLGESTFKQCESLTTVTMTNSVTSIGDSAFEDCDALTDVYYGGTEAQWDAITIGTDNDPLENATIHCTVPTLTHIAVVRPPTKTAYTVGDTFSPVGMSVTAFYSNGSYAAVTSYSISPATALTVSDTVITISYTEGGVTKTATVAITVTEPEPVTLSSIAITTPPTKTAYAWGEAFDPSEMVVTATYSDNSTATVTGYSVSPSGRLATSDNAVTISYTEDGVTASATVAITVTVKPFPTGWPRSAREVMREIAYRIGTPLDPRTSATLGLDDIEDSALKMSMREIAGYIAAMYGGNWTVTDDGYLYLVPLGMAARVLGDENGVPILFGEALLLV